MIQISSVQEGTEDFDVAFWSTQSADQKFEAAWKMVVLAHEMKGGDASELRLDRSKFYIGPRLEESLR